MKKVFLGVIVFLLALSTLAIVQNSVTAFSETDLQYKHHIWKINNVDLSVTYDLNNSKAESDLNNLFDKLSGIINGFDNSEIHIYTGKIKTEEDSFGKKVLYIAPFVKLSSRVNFDSELFLTLNSIANWSEGEDLYIDSETADELAFFIPQDSVIPLIIVPAEIYFVEPGIPKVIALPQLKVVNYPKIILDTVMHTLDGDLGGLSAGVSNTMPLSLDKLDFILGMPIAEPSTITWYSTIWQSTDIEGITTSYSESNGKATFSADGTFNEDNISANGNIKFVYDLDTGLLASSSGSLQISISGISFETAKLGEVKGSISISTSYEINYQSTENYEAWESPSEPLAYKITTFDVSEPLAKLFNETIEFESEETIFEDDFESGVGDWTYNGTWMLENLIVYSGSYAWGSTALDPENVSVLTSPSMDVSGYDEVTLEFYYYVNTSSFWGLYVDVQVSWDGGLTWKSIGSLDRTDEAWSWFTEDLDVKGDTLMVRFVTVTGSSSTYMDIAVIDAFRVYTTSSIELGVFDLLRNLRTINVFVDNPTGLDAEYQVTEQYVDPDTGEIYNLSTYTQSQGTFIAGALKVIPEKDFIYGQMLLEVHTITNILPKVFKYKLHYINKTENVNVPIVDISGSCGVYESTEGHFAILSNLTFTIDYSTPNPGETPFIMKGKGGLWYVYKSTGYLVSVGVQFSVSIKNDTDGDGDLNDESFVDYSFTIIANKVVSKKVTKGRAETWVIDWDTLDSPPPSWSNAAAWKMVTSPEGGGGILTSYVALIGIVAAIGVVFAVMLLLKRRGKE